MEIKNAEENLSNYCRWSLDPSWDSKCDECSSTIVGIDILTVSFHPYCIARRKMYTNQDVKPSYNSAK